jgi:hypothetical protein
MTLHLVSLGTGVTATNTGERGSTEMMTKTKLLGSSLLLSLIIMLPATVRAESAVIVYERANQLFEQIQDLELMQRNVEECYRAEKRTPIVACWSGQSWRDHAELDGKLMNRVFGHLAGTPEYERFIMEYRTLIQRPDYNRLHADKLFAEYVRLLESGRARLMNQCKDLQKSLPEDGSTQFRERLPQSIPVKTVTLGQAEGSQRTESGRVVPAIRFQVQMPLSGSTPLAVGQKSVVHGIDQFGSPHTVAHAIDLVELNTLVAHERIVPLEKAPMGDHHGLVNGARLVTPTNFKLSDTVEKGVGAWN